MDDLAFALEQADFSSYYSYRILYKNLNNKVY